MDMVRLSILCCATLAACTATAVSSESGDASAKSLTGHTLQPYGWLYVVPNGEFEAFDNFMAGEPLDPEALAEEAAIKEGLAREPSIKLLGERQDIYYPDASLESYLDFGGGQAAQLVGPVLLGGASKDCPEKANATRLFGLVAWSGALAGDFSAGAATATSAPTTAPDTSDVLPDMLDQLNTGGASPSPVTQTTDSESSLWLFLRGPSSAYEYILPVYGAHRVQYSSGSVGAADDGPWAVLDVAPEYFKGKKGGKTSLFKGNAVRYVTADTQQKDVEDAQRTTPHGQTASAPGTDLQKVLTDEHALGELGELLHDRRGVPDAGDRNGGNLLCE